MMGETVLNSLIPGSINIRQVEPHIYSVYSKGEHTNIYDKTSIFYDLVVSNRFYNQVMWGYRTSEFLSFCHDRLASSTEGCVLDIGCGSLVFTARAYAGYPERPVVFSDESIKMLRAAKSRLKKLNGSIPSNMVFLHADAQQLPFNPRSFHTIISMNMLHVLQDIKRVILGMENVLDDGGTMSFTSLILNNRFGDRYLKLLGRMGQVVPRTPTQLLSTFTELGISVEYHVKGNMMFIYCVSHGIVVLPDNSSVVNVITDHEDTYVC